MLEQYKLQYAEYLESLPEDKRQEELQSNQPKKKKTTQKETKALAKKIENVKATSSKIAANKIDKKPLGKKKNSKISPDRDKLFANEPEQPPP